MVANLHTDTPCLLEIWDLEGQDQPGWHTATLPSPHTQGFQSKGPHAIKTQLNFSLL